MESLSGFSLAFLFFDLTCFRGTSVLLHITIVSSFYCWGLSYGINMLRIVYPFPCWLTLDSYWVLGFVIRANINILTFLYKVLFVDMYFNLLGKYLEVYLLFPGVGWASLVALWWGICLPMQKTWVRSLGWEDPLKETVTHLPGKSQGRGVWWATVHNVAELDTA